MKTVYLNPLLVACEEGDWTAFGPFADVIEEVDGNLHLAFAFRWCWKRERKPAKREVRTRQIETLELDEHGIVYEERQFRPKKPYLWFGDGDHTRDFLKSGEERNLWDAYPHARLPKQVYFGLFIGLYKRPFMIYSDFMSAMRALAESLRSMQEELKLF